MRWFIPNHYPHNTQNTVRCEQWCMLNWLTEHTVKQRMEVLKWKTVRVCRKSIKMYSKWRKSTVLVVKLQQSVYFVAKEPENSRHAYRRIRTLIGPKLIVPAVSLALSQRTTNNLDEASIKAKHPTNIQISSNIWSAIQLFSTKHNTIYTGIFMINSKESQ